MDSLQLISSINERISELDNKIIKTSKSASVAFSYLYSKINEFNKTDTDLENKIQFTNERLTYLSSKADIISNNSYSYFVTISNDLDTVINSTVTTTVKSIQDELNEIRKDINELKEKLVDIEKVPERYIVVKKEKTTFHQILSNISDFFFKLFHARKIKQERIEQKILEQERREIEKQAQIELEIQRKVEEEKRNAEAKKKIKELIKK